MIHPMTSYQSSFRLEQQRSVLCSSEVAQAAERHAHPPSTCARACDTPFLLFAGGRGLAMMQAMTSYRSSLRLHQQR